MIQSFKTTFIKSSCPRINSPLYLIGSTRREVVEQNTGKQKHNPHHPQQQHQKQQQQQYHTNSYLLAVAAAAAETDSEMLRDGETLLRKRKWRSFVRIERHKNSNNIKIGRNVKIGISSGSSAVYRPPTGSSSSRVVEEGGRGGGGENKRIGSSMDIKHLEIYRSFWPHWYLRLCPKFMRPKPLAKCGMRLYGTPCSPALEKAIVAHFGHTDDNTGANNACVDDESTGSGICATITASEKVFIAVDRDDDDNDNDVDDIYNKSTQADDKYKLAKDKVSSVLMQQQPPQQHQQMQKKKICSTVGVLIYMWVTPDLRKKTLENKGFRRTTHMGELENIRIRKGTIRGIIGRLFSSLQSILSFLNLPAVVLLCGNFGSKNTDNDTIQKHNHPGIKINDDTMSINNRNRNNISNNINQNSVDNNNNENVRNKQTWYDMSSKDNNDNDNNNEKVESLSISAGEDGEGTAAAVTLATERKIDSQVLGFGDYFLSWVRQCSRENGDSCLLLVHDDQGSGRLVEFYRQRGFFSIEELIPKGMVCVL